MTYQWKQMKDGEWHWPLALRLHGCCDCGLVHNVKWRLRGGAIEWAWSRDTNATRASRRARLAAKRKKRRA